MTNPPGAMPPLPKPAGFRAPYPDDNLTCRWVWSDKNAMPRSEPVFSADQLQAYAAPLIARVAELERQNEAQKDEWLSWDAKRAALEKDSARWRFSMRYQKRYEETPELRCEAMDEMWRKVYQERRRAPTREEYEAATDAAIAECAAVAAKD